MLENVEMQWYRRRFSDPETIALLVILVAGFSILFSAQRPVSAAAGHNRTGSGTTCWVADGAPAGVGCSRRWAASIVLISLSAFCV